MNDSTEAEVARLGERLEAAIERLAETADRLERSQAEATARLERAQEVTEKQVAELKRDVLHYKGVVGGAMFVLSGMWAALIAFKSWIFGPGGNGDS